jgi:hypothetical protein
MSAAATGTAPEVLDPARRARLERGARAVLEQNWREGRRPDGARYAFTCPSTPRYRHQWYWDSCFHAIVRSRWDPARAREELRTLLRAGRGDGFIPHTTFWDHPALWRRAPFYGTHTRFGALATATIQTPLLAHAWEQVARRSPDAPGFAGEALEDLRLHYDWLDRERDPDGDGLITIIHPDESGLDDTPKYDRVWGWMRHDRPGHLWLVERHRHLRYRGPAIIARYDEHVEDVLVNVAYALSLRSLSRLLDEGAHGRYALRARRTEQALLERCLEARSGLFLDLAGRAERPIDVSTWSALAPLALDALPEDVRRRLVEEHLLDPRRYRVACGIPSVAVEERCFNPRWDRFRTWRGPSWMNIAWLLVPPMRELGYARDADRIVASLAAAVERAGWREYYHPFTGAGLGAKGFGMSTLLVELL